jgi:hypothetical protein
MKDTNVSEQNQNGFPRRRRHLERLSHDRSLSILWATILVWGAVVLAIEMTSVSANNWWNSGAFFLIGTGTIILMEGIYRVIKAETQRRILFRFILSVVFICAGLASIISFSGNVVALVALLLIAGAILLNGLFHDTEKR